MYLQAHAEYATPTPTPPKKLLEFVQISRPTLAEVGWARVHPCPTRGYATSTRYCFFHLVALYTPTRILPSLDKYLLSEPAVFTVTVRRIFSEFRVISRVLEATTAKRMQIDPHYQQRKCSPVNVVSSSIRFGRIFAGVREILGLKQGGVGKISRFLPLSVNISKTVPDTAKVTIND